MSKVLLFAHPGREHVPPARSRRSEMLYPWSTYPAHRRKFLICGAALAEARGGGYAMASDTRQVGLWGEWEPPSMAGWHPPSQEPMTPEAWHRPLLDQTSLNDPPRGAQNTDPWIFGPVMRYSNCLQRSHVALRDLKAGDVVFFGSLKQRDRHGAPAERFGFFLDTVFVVGRSAPHRQPAGERDLLFRRAVLERLRDDVRPLLTMYDGRMLDSESSTGPFSWVPCRPLAGGDPQSGRFARPLINDLLGLPDMGTNPRLAYREVELAPHVAWKLVADQCADLELNMAVRVDPAGAQSSQHRVPRAHEGLADRAAAASNHRAKN
jgi:hypothetical protein